MTTPRVIPSEVEGRRLIQSAARYVNSINAIKIAIPVRNLGFFRGILRLRCAPLRMTVNQ
jgi:hypothetical protein